MRPMWTPELSYTILEMHKGSTSEVRPSRTPRRLSRVVSGRSTSRILVGHAIATHNRVRIENRAQARPIRRTAEAIAATVITYIFADPASTRIIRRCSGARPILLIATSAVIFPSPRISRQQNEDSATNDKQHVSASPHMTPLCGWACCSHPQIRGRLLNRSKFQAKNK